MSLKHRIAALEKQFAAKGRAEQSVSLTFLLLTQADEHDPRFMTWSVEEAPEGRQSPVLTFGGVVRLYAKTGEQFRTLTEQYQAAQTNDILTVTY